MEKIPHFRREQITLIKFLGSGAFGKVYEGVARQVNGATSETKVAVKVSLNYYLLMIFIAVDLNGAINLHYSTSL